MPAVLKCARRRRRRRKMQDAAAEIREIVDRETRAWDTQDAELLLSVFHPDMVWPCPGPPPPTIPWIGCSSGAATTASGGWADGKSSSIPTSFYATSGSPRRPDRK